MDKRLMPNCPSWSLSEEVRGKNIISYMNNNEKFVPTTNDLKSIVVTLKSYKDEDIDISELNTPAHLSQYINMDSLEIIPQKTEENLTKLIEG